jgi:hypothetical protein
MSVRRIRTPRPHVHPHARMSTRMSARMSARVSARMPDQEAIYLFKAARRQRLPHAATDMLA